MAWLFDSWFCCRNHVIKWRPLSTTWNLRFFLYLLIINKFHWLLDFGRFAACFGLFLFCSLLWQDIALIPLHPSCMCRLFSWSSAGAGLQFWHHKTFRYLHICKMNIQPFLSQGTFCMIVIPNVKLGKIINYNGMPCTPVWIAKPMCLSTQEYWFYCV